MRGFIRLAVSAAALPLTLSLVPANAQTAPKFAVDASWPKELPKDWITGQLGGVCTAEQDHIYVVNRRNITDEEKETSISAPSIIKFDMEGNVVGSWGDQSTVPNSIHGCFVDQDKNVYVAGNSDGIVQKYAPDGKLLLQIGTKGKFDSVDGTRRGKGNNSAQDQLHMPSGIVVDPGNGDIYISDGYGNRRVAVFDKAGKLLRQWGRQATEEESQKNVPGVFAEVVHCIAMSNAGLIYACDRQGNRVQVFRKDGSFVKEFTVEPRTAGNGSVWDIVLSRDPQQRWLHLADGRNNQVLTLERETGAVAGALGRPGRYAGEFHWVHDLAIDSKGNLYAGEVDTGKRVQRFVRK